MLKTVSIYIHETVQLWF